MTVAATGDATVQRTTLTCTVVDGCTGEAVLQATRACDSCGGESADLRSSAEQRREELAALERRDEQVKAQARARDGRCGCGDESSHDGSDPASGGKPTPCPRPQSGDLTELEVLDLRISADRRRDLGEQVEQLDAAAGQVAKEHTHPVFACEKHTSRLPK